MAKGAVDEAFAATFTAFIRNGLDKLISPEDMLLEKNKEKVLRELETSIKPKGDKDFPHIAALLAFRFGNYLVKHTSKQKLTDDNLERIYDIWNSGLFNKDLQYVFMSKLVNIDKRIFGKYPEIGRSIAQDE
jgi:hypothetical protein